MKKMKKLFVFSVLSMFISSSAFAAYLGFDKEDTIVKPGEPFTVNLVAFFNADDPHFWSEDPIVRISLYDWIGSISVISCEWNNSEWNFNEANTFFGETETTSFLWAEATPYSRNSLTSQITLATLHCFAYDTFGEILGYDKATNYFGINGDVISYETTGYEKIYTNFPTSISCNDNDILGESNNSEDGTATFNIKVYDMPSYKIDLSPETSDIPLTLSPTSFEINVSKMSKTLNPADYDHVRLVIEYDREFIKCINSETIINSIPNFLTNVTVSVLTNKFYDFSITEDIIIEGYCEPTDFEGTIATIELLPLKMEQNVELDFTGWFIDKPTVIDRFGKADLLESSEDETDGFPESFLNITNVPDLFFNLENSESYLVSGAESETRLILNKNSSDNIVIDSLTFEFLYNTNLLSMLFSEFFPCSNSIYSSGTNVTISFSDLDNLILPSESLSNEYSIFLTNSKVRLNIDFDSPLVITQEFTEIGTFNFIPKVPGKSGFMSGETKIINNESDIHDSQKQLTTWPFTFFVLESGESDNQLFVSLISDDKNPEDLTPGHFVDFNIYSYCDRPISNASYFLCWTYDSSALSFESSSPSITNLNIIINSDETSSVIYIQSEDYASISSTNFLGKITFKTLKPKTVIFEPVTFDLSETHYCRFEENEKDILGSAYSNDDGVVGDMIDIESIDELTLIFEPTAALHAGLQANSFLELENPDNVFWDYCSLKIILDKEEILVTTNKWQTKLSEQFQVVSNYIKVIDIPVVFTNVKYGVTNVYEITNEWFEACLAIKSLTPTNFSGRIGSLPIIPLEDSPYWEYIFKDCTKLSFNDVVLTDFYYFNSDFWNVNPNYMLIELKDQIKAPILGIDYLLTAQIKNPLNIPINRTTICWSFDSQIMEIKKVDLINGFSGDVWINNNNDGFGYICGDISQENYISSSNIPIMNITIYPKVVEILELEPDEDVMENDAELGMGIFSKNNINLLELLYGSDNPYWERSVVYRSMPQLQFDDIEIEKNSFYVIEDLFMPGEGLINGDEYLNKNLLWWTEGNENIEVVFNSLLNTARFSPKFNWVGEEVFRIYCKDSNNQVGSSLVRVVIEENSFELDVDVEHEEYLAATSLEFNEIKFKVNNSSTNKFEVFAFFINSDGLTNYAKIQDIDSGEIVSSPKNFSNGRLIWKIPSTRGIFVGKVVVKNPNNVLQTDTDTFLLELVKGDVDEDGDRFQVIVENANSWKKVGRSITIDSSTDKASVKVKVFKNINGGDGRIPLDSIKCNKGLKNITLIGNIHLIETGGPIGSLKVRQGTVGSINVANGGINSISINNNFNKEYEDYYEAGILRGITCDGDIGSIKVVGGNIGDEYEPAIIKTKGSVKNIIIKRNKKTIMDDGWADIYLLGGNFYASLYVDGDIGSIKTIGGSIGVPDADEYAFSEIECKGNIKTISAVAKKGDGEVLGGYIHSDIFCEGHIKKISAIGGDIIVETELDPEDVADDVALNTIYVTASSIKIIESRCKVYLFKDGEKNSEWWYWEAHGGNIVIDVRTPVKPKPTNQKFTIGKILAAGGTLCSYIETLGSIKKIQTKRISYHEDLESGNKPRGGSMVFSSIKPNINDKDLNNPKLFSYNGYLKSLSIQGIIKNTKIFSKGPFDERKIKYGALQDNSEVWIDGQKVLSSN